MKRAVVLLALAALAATTSVSFAVDTTEITAQAAGRISSIPLSDTQGPASTGALLAAVLWGPNQGFDDPSTAAAARAAQDVEGRSAVYAEASPAQPASDFQTAESRWTRTLTHPGPAPAEYVYEFFVSPPRLALRNACGLPSLSALARYEITVKLDGNTIFQSSATLTGTASNPQLVESGTDLGGTFFSHPASADYGYQFSTFDGSLSLGIVQPGQTLVVETTLRVRTEIGESCTGAHANIGDPLDLGGDPGVRGMLFSTGFVGVGPAAWSGIKSLYR